MPCTISTVCLAWPHGALSSIQALKPGSRGAAISAARTAKFPELWGAGWAGWHRSAGWGQSTPALTGFMTGMEVSEPQGSIS